MWALLHLIVRQCGRLGNSFQSSWVLGLPMSPATCFSAHLQSFPCKSADLGSCRVLNRRVPRPVGQVAGPHQFCWTKSRGGLQVGGREGSCVGRGYFDVLVLGRLVGRRGCCRWIKWKVDLCEI